MNDTDTAADEILMALLAAPTVARYMRLTDTEAQRLMEEYRMWYYGKRADALLAVPKTNMEGRQ